jgi:hypothetical protein
MTFFDSLSLPLLSPSLFLSLSLSVSVSLCLSPLSDGEDNQINYDKRLQVPEEEGEEEEQMAVPLLSQRRLTMVWFSVLTVKEDLMI